MAINVNTVYTTVLSILNKEQRGYLTPYEFNKAATQSQLDIFEKYFTDLDGQLRIPQNEFDYSNPLSNIDDGLSTFKCFGACTGGTAGKFNLPTTDTLTGKTIVYNDQPSSTEFAFYRLGTVTFDSATAGVKPVEIERIQRDYFYNIDRSDLTTPSENYPVYLYEGVNAIFVKPTTITANVETTFLRKPVNPVWGFTVNSVGAYIYDSTPGTSVDFEISSNDQTELILEILKYAGVVIRDPQIVQVASQELAQE
jgi:hypothetical protein